MRPVRIRPLSISGAFVVEPVVHRDDRGEFLEFYRFDRLTESVGHPLDLRQGNISVSRRGTLRGIHFADVPRGQAKYVTVLSGAAIDYVVDLRTGSPTFGTWEEVPLDPTSHHAVYLAEGLGHAFLALEDDTVLSYLVSDVYRPDREHGVNPLDPALGIRYPLQALELVVAQKDREAPSLAEATDAGLLPTWAECLRYDQERAAESEASR